MTCEGDKGDNIERAVYRQKPVKEVRKEGG